MFQVNNIWVDQNGNENSVVDQNLKYGSKNIYVIEFSFPRSTINFSNIF